MSMKKKNERVVIIIVIATILVLGYLVYFNIKKNAKVEINASVKETGNGYIIVVDDTDDEYLLETDGNYDVGDKVSAVIKRVEKGTPSTCEVVKINTVSKTVAFSITDISDEETSDQNAVNSKDYSNSTNNGSDTGNRQSETATDDNVISYFNTFSNEIDNTSELKSSIKEKFVTVVDFLFYDGEIKGKTFKELSTSAKLKVLQIFLKIDNKIENKFPNYKQSISSTGNKVYTNAKSKALETYFDLTTEVCSNDYELCNTAKDGLKDLKESFTLTWDLIKEASGAGISKLKSWYEIWREI